MDDQKLSELKCINDDDFIEKVAMYVSEYIRLQAAKTNKSTEYYIEALKEKLSKI